MNFLENSNNKTPRKTSQSLIAFEESADNTSIQGHYSNSLVIEPTVKQFLINQNTNQGRSLSSILKKGSKASLDSQYRYSSGSDRRDTFGVLIVRGSKKHKIKFKPEIREVSIVENWKNFNVQEHETCACILI